MAVLKIFQIPRWTTTRREKDPIPLYFLKRALSRLRQFVATGSPLNLMENAFYFILKALFVLKILSFCLYFVVM